MTKGQEKNRERDDALQQFTYMLEEADGYVDLLDWNNLLGKSYCIYRNIYRKAQITLYWHASFFLNTVSKKPNFPENQTRLAHFGPKTGDFGIQMNNFFERQK